MTLPSYFSWYPYLPPVFAVYLIGMSYFSSLYAKRLIESRNVRDVAEDWAARIGFINVMISSLASLYSIFETSQSYASLTLSSIILFALFFPMLFWVIIQGPGDLYRGRVRTWLGNIFRKDIIAMTLVLINLVLIGAIFFNQKNSPRATAAPAAQPTATPPAEPAAAPPARP